MPLDPGSIPGSSTTKRARPKGLARFWFRQHPLAVVSEERFVARVFESQRMNGDLAFHDAAVAVPQGVNQRNAHRFANLSAVECSQVARLPGKRLLGQRLA